MPYISVPPAFPLRHLSMGCLKQPSLYWSATSCRSDRCAVQRPSCVRFREATALGQEDIAAVQHAGRKRVLRLFERRGLLAPEADGRDAPRQWGHGGGFSLDATVRIEARDRKGLARLLCYCARPILAPSCRSRPLEPHRWTRVRAKGCHLCVLHSSPEPGQGQPKRPLPARARTAKSPAARPTQQYTLQSCV